MHVQAVSSLLNFDQVQRATSHFHVKKGKKMRCLHFSGLRCHSNPHSCCTMTGQSSSPHNFRASIMELSKPHQLAWDPLPPPHFQPI